MLLKLKRTPGIYLVGFMACGKTTVGRLLAESLGWSFVDLDEEIETAAGVSINEMFDTRGETEFRRLESAALSKHVRMVEEGKPSVVALGGGALTQPENFRLVSDNGVSVWLDCPLEVLQQRVAKVSDRPLARDPDQFVALYEARLPVYRRADFRVDASGDDASPIVDQILKLPVF